MYSSDKVSLRKSVIMYKEFACITDYDKKCSQLLCNFL